MTDSLVFQLTDKGLVTDSLTLDIGYDRGNCDKGIYHGPVHIDHYGRTVPKGAHGSTQLDNPTNLSSQLMAATTELFDRIANRNLTVRRITIAANRVVKDQGKWICSLTPASWSGRNRYRRPCSVSRRSSEKMLF